MSEKEHHDVDRTACVADLKCFLAEARDLRLAAAADPVRGQRRDRLRAWQAARLAKTHADLLASPQFSIAATFFLSDLYGPKDFSERDAEMEKVLPIMTTMLPVSGLRTLFWRWKSMPCPSVSMPRWWRCWASAWIRTD